MAFLENAIHIGIGDMEMIHPFPVPVQSLAHMKVLHRHCVFFSLFPLGPRGLAHIQNERPQFTPGFLVSIVLQGSPCSQLGEIGLEKSFPQPCLDVSALASSIVVMGLGPPRTLPDSSCLMTSALVETVPLIPPWPSSVNTAISVGCGVSSLTVSTSLALADPLVVCALVWKKPLRLCWPLPDALVPPDCGADLVRFAEGIVASGFCILLEPAEGG